MREGGNELRIAFFGGTFDPPHRGHLAVATAVANDFALDRMLLAPTGRQPLKTSQPEAGFGDRLAMVRLLCEDEPVLEASEIDSPQPDGKPNYTIDALRRLRRQHAEAQIFVIAGLDAFLDLRRWREPDDLLESAEWIAVSRPGFDSAQLTALSLSAEQRARVHLCERVHVPVSATEVRTCLRSGGDCSGMLTPAVLAYIREHRLYGTTRVHARENALR